ncbi:hypothetical protein BKA70DRAFT_1422909 [Coprinopsis sp. MPI-PUGE-AT-0042]|nr:hypothetical protein BKA70DRAFT_1422909 [Coprinopsis sp. MPI-PUGE-AT-0042]
MAPTGNPAAFKLDVTYIRRDEMANQCPLLFLRAKVGVGDDLASDHDQRYVTVSSPTSIATLKERPCADDQLHPGETLARIPAHEALFEMTLSALDGQSRIVADSSGTRVLFQTHPEYSSKRWED